MLPLGTWTPLKLVLGQEVFTEISKFLRRNLEKSVRFNDMLTGSVVSVSLLTPWTVACQARLSMGFSRQEYWRGLSFPSPGDLPYPGIKPRSPALQADALTSEPPRKPFAEISDLKSLLC